MPIKFDIATMLLSLLGMGAAWLVKGGVQYGINRIAKPRISSSVSRANMQDTNAIASESLVLQAAQMHQQENADLRKEQKEMYASMLKMATEFGKAQGKLEVLQPPQADIFADAVMVEPDTDTLKSSTELEFLPKSQRKPHLLTQEKSNDFNFGEDFQSRTRNAKSGTRANTETNDRTAFDDGER